MRTESTIAAIATPPGEGGVGIIRISGTDAYPIGRSLFLPQTPISQIIPRHLYYGTFLSVSSVSLDSGLFVYMPGPASFTGEDVVELHCHGGGVVLKTVFETVLKHGALIAEPGEFTKRAFLNGKMDLVQAEAVIEVIRAQTEAALSAANERLSGLLSAEVRDIGGRLLTVVAHVEAELDFQEDEIDPLSDDQLLEGLGSARRSIERLLSTYDEGKAVRDGIKVLILGRPNVGKSSLLNLLLKEERAIVTPIPGTTRDLIEEAININGVPVRLMDTAGLRDGADDVEAIGIGLARGRIKDADLILFVVDSSVVSYEEDLVLLKETAGKKTLIVANKCDIDLDRKDRRPSIETAFSQHEIIRISALERIGIDGLNDAIYRAAAGDGISAGHDAAQGPLLASIRHKRALEGSSQAIERAVSDINAGTAREFIALDLRAAIDSLGEITGETTTEDILEKIFSDFCIGK
ncbi:MAG: tRNA uridine-5-carboxymethylaminomethyl(34) synthesis GTPase MnmE [Deltaproteobacteria bacterium]